MEKWRKGRREELKGEKKKKTVERLRKQQRKKIIQNNEGKRIEK